MGYKISAILGGLLLISVAGSAWYIDRLLDEISTLKGNQVILETEIQKQNDAIDKFLENEQRQQQEPQQPLQLQARPQQQRHSQQRPHPAQQAHPQAQA